MQPDTETLRDARYNDMEDTPETAAKVMAAKIIRDDYRGSGKLQGKAALITGGSSGIGRAVAVHFAREGADVAIVYLQDTDEADQTKRMVEQEGRTCLLFKGDVSDENFARQTVRDAQRQLGRLDIMVNNAAVQFPHEDFADITTEEFRKTFEVNIFSFYYFTQEALKYLSGGGCVVNTASVTAYKGNQMLIDYSSTKGAIVSFTRALAAQLAPKNIRVNAVAPGPIWTPLIPESFGEKTDFGQDTPLGRAGEPAEVAPAYVFLASQDASYITGQVIHVNGGSPVNG